MKAALFCSIILSLSVAATGVDTTGPTTCRVLPSPVLEGEPASLTCSFPRDLYNKSFTVKIYQTVNGTDMEDPAFTLIAEPGIPNPDIPQNGFKLSGNITDEMRLIIGSTQNEYAGSYSCRLSNAKDHSFTFCKLEVTGKATVSSCDVQPVMTGEDATIICHFNKDLRLGRREIMVQKQSKDGVVLETVVDCVKEPKENYNCHYNDSLYYVDTDGFKPSTFSVLIRNVSKASEGRYACKLLSAASERPTSCTLKLSEAKEPAPEKSGGNDANTPSTVAIIALVVAVIEFIIIIITIIICAVRRKQLSENIVRCANAAPRPVNTEDDTDQQRQNEQDGQQQEEEL